MIMRSINEYFSQSEKISSINEYLLSKKNQRIEDYIKGDMSSDEFAKILEEFGYKKYEKELYQVEQIYDELYNNIADDKIVNIEHKIGSDNFIICNKNFPGECKFIFISHYYGKLSSILLGADDKFISGAQEGNYFDKDDYKDLVRFLNEYINC